MEILAPCLPAQHSAASRVLAVRGGVQMSLYSYLHKVNGFYSPPTSLAWIPHPLMSGQGPRTARSLLVKPSPPFASTGCVLVSLDGDLTGITARC